MAAKSFARKKVLLKVIIVGNSGVGKTAILSRYVKGEFVDDHKATIGADFTSKELTIEDKTITLQIWDTAGQERFQSLGTAFYRGADACILVYDVTDEESFKQIENWNSKFLEQASPEDAANFPFLLLGNKTDLGDARLVSKTQGQALADKLRLIFYETSAKNDAESISNAFKEIANVASDRDTAPYFSEELAEKITDLAAESSKKPDEAGCACSLI